MSAAFPAPRVWAGFDVGTNSVKLLVGRVAFDPASPRLEVLHHDVRVTRMGEGLNATGQLSEAGMERALEALEALAEAARSYGPQGLSALGMEAFRRASNGLALARRVHDTVGIPLRIVTGEEEARLGREGVLLGYGAPLPASVLVVDVGGGSSELALTDPEWQVSVPRGAVTATEAWLRADPPSSDEMGVLRSALRTLFEEAWGTCPAREAVPTVVAVGGTVTSYAAMQLQLETWDSARVHRMSLERSEVRALTDHLAALPLELRRQVPGLHPGRAPFIVGGGAILESILETVGAARLFVSVANLLHAHVVVEAERAVNAEHTGRG